MKKYFYQLLAKYCSVHIQPENSVLEINPKSDLLLHYLRASKKDTLYLHYTGSGYAGREKLGSAAYDYVLIHGGFHYEPDVQAFLDEVRKLCRPETRIIACYYSALWKPLTRLATFLRLREKLPEQNWFTHTDMRNFALLSDLEVINLYQKILLPVRIPGISNFVNKWLAPLPFFRLFTMVNICLLKTVQMETKKESKSVSIVVPARNEAGNIEHIVKRTPRMGPDDELIFVEGHSTDNTWQEIQRVQEKYKTSHAITIARQEGKGKADAVRKGFKLAKNDILMILDADMTVPPETLPRFYRSIMSGKGEFINGSRLVYPMEQKAMRFFNLLGNKFFACAFSFVLSQPIKDTLCGTKVITKENYLKLEANRSYLGDFDPFGDFDLLFGASRMGLKILEVPVTYKARSYGDTNIQRWKHGMLLLRMLIFAAQKFKFI